MSTNLDGLLDDALAADAQRPAHRDPLDPPEEDELDELVDELREVALPAERNEEQQ